MLGQRRRVALVRVTDLTARERSVVCEVSSMGPLLAGWWSELGLSTAAMGSHARTLIAAARSGDWATVHVLADHVSLDVSAVHAMEAGMAVFTPGDSWAAGL